MLTFADPFYRHTETSEMHTAWSINKHTYDKLKLDMSNLTIDYQMIIRALKVKLNIVEFSTKEGERLFGETNFKSIPTGIAELKMLIREIKIGCKF